MSPIPTIFVAKLPHFCSVSKLSGYFLLKFIFFDVTLQKCSCLVRVEALSGILIFPGAAGDIRAPGGDRGLGQVAGVCVEVPLHHGQIREARRQRHTFLVSDDVLRVILTRVQFVELRSSS